MSLYLGENCISAGGSSAFKNNNIGEIIQSTIPLTDAGLHLLDGALISGNGAYSAFYEYIVSLYSSYPQLYTDEAGWQSAVSTYGVCGKFVFNTTNRTVRLPKYNSKIYTGGGTAPVIGNGMALGLTNGSQNGGLHTINAGNTGTLIGNPKQYGQNVGNSSTGNSHLNYNLAVGVTTDGSNSGLVADLSNITTSLDGYYYIVLTNSVKTNIEVDIDEIATDLNGKADVDLSNVNVSGTSLASGWSMPSSRYIDLTLGASGATYTAPANGYFYLQKIATSTTQVLLMVNNSKIGSIFTTNDTNRGVQSYIPVSKGDTLSVTYSLGGATTVFRFVYAEGEN